MYQQHFGFHGKPFQSSLSERAFFQSKSLTQVIPVVLHTLRSDLGVAVLTGPAGIGKSAALKHLQQQLQTDGRTVLIPAGAVRTSTDLLALLYRRLKQDKDSAADESRSETAAVKRWQVVERMARIVDFWGPVIVLLDDAHLAAPEIFAELRSLLEEEADGRRLVRVLVCGALPLEDVLAAPAMTDFVQKIRSHVFPEPLRADEAVAYLKKHLTAVGSELSRVFQPAAVQQIVSAADGVPRCLNLLADEALVLTAEASESVVTAEHVQSALRRLQHLPYSWNISASADDDYSEPTTIDQQAPAARSQTADRQPVTSSPATGSYSATAGVIEVGAPAQSATGKSPSAKAVSPDLKASQPGVIEVGAECAVSKPAAEKISAAKSTAEKIIAEQPAVDESALIPAAVKTDHIDCPAEPENVPVHVTVSGESDPQDESDTDDAGFADVASAVVPVTLLKGFEPWTPPGAWQERPASQPASSSWVRLPRGVTPMPVFDRYTWQEYGREIPFGDTVGQRYADVTDVPLSWPPDLNGVGPASEIRVHEMFAELASVLMDDDTFSTDSAEEVTGRALTSQHKALSVQAMDSALQDSDTLPEAEQFADLNDETDVDDIQPGSGLASFDELEGWTAEESAENWHDGRLLDEFIDGSDAADDSESDEVISLPISEAVSRDEAVTSPKKTSAEVEDSEPVSRESRPGRQTADSGAFAVAADSDPDQVRFYSLPLQLQGTGYGTQAQQASELRVTPVAGALLQLQQGTVDRPPVSGTAAGQQKAVPTEAADVGEENQKGDARVSGAADQQPPRDRESADNRTWTQHPAEPNVPEGRLTGAGKLRFETLFTRLRRSEKQT